MDFYRINYKLMPHVVLTGKNITLNSFHNTFEKRIVRYNNLKENKKSNRIIRLDDNLISVSKDTVLVKATVIVDVQHEQKCQTFYILISKKGEQQVTIRLDPLTDPSAKTDGVKMALTLVTRSILQYAGTDLRVTKTNISDFLQDQKLWQNEV